jgi:hypothetical protein
MLPALCSFALRADLAPVPIVTRSVAANRIAECPEYVRPQGAGSARLDFGLESRWRYEFRRNDYASKYLDRDDAVVSRTMLYLGLKEVVDPLRLALELQDSRRFLSERAPDPKVSDHLEPIQAMAQLYFPETFSGMPIKLSFGRMAFDAVDRRLITRNRNRNTINTFDGFRLRLGDETRPWEIDSIAVRPTQRTESGINRFNETADNVSLYGVMGYWRPCSPLAVLEPYWLWLDQSGAATLAQQRDIHTFGLHAYGQWGVDQSWHYDLSLAAQLGEARGLRHRALAGHAEIGYTFSAPYSPQIAGWLNYASGDRNPQDQTDNSFDPLFGATYTFYGYTGHFMWQNVVNPALRFSFQPTKSVRAELMHRTYWLACASDRWARGANRQDPSGQGGSFVGQEFDARLVWQISRHFDIDAAYAHFIPGRFVHSTGPSPDADFLQVAATLRF